MVFQKYLQHSKKVVRKYYDLPVGNAAVQDFPRISSTGMQIWCKSNSKLSFQLEFNVKKVISKKTLLKWWKKVLI